jgi:heat shock protein HslJ
MGRKNIRKAIFGLIPGMFCAGIIASCATTPPSLDESRLEEKVWLVVGLDGREVKEEKNLTLRFSGSDVVNGDAACNEFFAPVRITGQLIAFGSISVTERSCDTLVINIDEVYFATLKKVRSWKIDENKLFLKNGAGTTLIEFSGKEWQPVKVSTAASGPV